MMVREMGMYWRRCGIRSLPYLDDLFFPKKGFSIVSVGGNTLEGDSLKAGLKINFPKSGLISMEDRRHLGFDMEHGTRYFIVCTGR